MSFWQPCRAFQVNGTPNPAVVAPREARHLGSERDLRKVVVVTQWGRAKAQVPPDQRLASRSVVTCPCKPSQGSTELGGTSVQAACGSPDLGRGVDIRLTLKLVRRGTPTVSRGRKATVPSAPRQESGTPPGFKSGAWRPRGHSGPGESQRSSGNRGRSGEPADATTLAWPRGASTEPRAGNGDHARREPAR